MKKLYVFWTNFSTLQIEEEKDIDRNPTTLGTRESEQARMPLE